MVEIEKPEMQVKKFYDFRDVMEYVKEKYGVDYRDVEGHFRWVKSSGTEQPPYKDAWHWMQDAWGLDNEKMFGIDLKAWVTEEKYKMPEHVKKVLQHVLEDFEQTGEDEYSFVVEW